MYNKSTNSIVYMKWTMLILNRISQNVQGRQLTWFRKKLVWEYYISMYFTSRDEKIRKENISESHFRKFFHCLAKYFCNNEWRVGEFANVADASFIMYTWWSIPHIFKLKVIFETKEQSNNKDDLSINIFFT